MSKVPILFLGFNRPEETAKSFACIREYQPKKLYVALDGPRNEKDNSDCDRVRNIVKNVDWHCDVKYLVRGKNLGCRKAVNEAIDWFFEAEEYGVIYEDDILANDAFFDFCSKMLLRYKNDDRIWLVTGNNLLGIWKEDKDYFFSRIGAIWGWATWRRAWQSHDKKMKNWPEVKRQGSLFSILPEKMADERMNVFQRVYEKKIDTWDYQFTFSRLTHSGLSIIPSRNLVENIGFTKDATHTKSIPQNICNTILVEPKFQGNEPVGIIPDIEFDQKVFENRVKSFGASNSLLKRIVKKYV
jgi:glycosyltransferase involved in cell wall biosynthesis